MIIYASYLVEIVNSKGFYSWLLLPSWKYVLHCLNVNAILLLKNQILKRLMMCHYQKVNLLRISKIKKTWLNIFKIMILISFWCTLKCICLIKKKFLLNSRQCLSCFFLFQYRVTLNKNETFEMNNLKLYIS